MHLRRIGAVMFGIAGMLVILRPGIHVVDIGAWAQITAAPLFAISFLISKKLTERESSMSIVAALSGTEIIHFWLALFALGLGWNFTFVGASTLLTETYTATERGKVQALNDFLVFGTVALASLTSGTILYFLNWNAVNIAAIGPIGVAVMAALWLRLKRRAEQAA